MRAEIQEHGESCVGKDELFLRSAPPMFQTPKD